MRVKDFIKTCVVAGAFGWLLASCSNGPGGAAAPSPGSAPLLESGGMMKTGEPLSVTPEVKKTRSRTGIATGWGREVGSVMTYTDFVRAESKPAYLTTIRYNDGEGAKSMGVDMRTKGRSMQKAAGGLIEWGMTSGWGGLGNYWWRGGRFVIGKKGREYQLKVKNISSARIEIVMSVDGLDVIDGQSASTKKRGYIINPGKTLTVKGFRTSHEAVATFKFSSVSGSYANLRHGNTRNVGVVGLALYTEKGRQPWAEAGHREGARAFADAPNVRARD